MEKINHNHCSLPRRVAAMIYDSILLCSIFFFSTYFFLVITDYGEIESGNLIYNGFLLLMAYLYFCWHWTKGRQTLGMRSWNINIITKTDNELSWTQASLRFFCAILSFSFFGLGYLWAIFDKQKSTLHDKLSRTKLIIDEA